MRPKSRPDPPKPFQNQSQKLEQIATVRSPLVRSQTDKSTPLLLEFEVIYFLRAGGNASTKYGLQVCRYLATRCDIARLGSSNDLVLELVLEFQGRLAPKEDPSWGKRGKLGLC